MEVFNGTLLCGHVAARDARGKLFCPRCSDVDLPEGVLRRDYSLDGKKLAIEFSKGKGFFLSTHLGMVVTKCSTIEHASVLHNVLLHFDHDKWKEVVKYAKQAIRNLQNSRSINVEAMDEWAVSMHVLRKVENRLCHNLQKGNVSEK
jgi:hypothetical protein